MEDDYIWIERELRREKYAEHLHHIADWHWLPENKIEAKVKGVTYEGRQTVVVRLSLGDIVLLRREPSNRYDPDAIRVERVGGEQVGYLPHTLAQEMAKSFDLLGQPVRATVTWVGREQSGKTHIGVRIVFQVPDVP